MVEQITIWPREREGVPFEAAAFNRVPNFFNGFLAAPFKLVQIGGNLALSWDPALDLFVFRASITIGATITLNNTIHLDGYAADGTSVIHLLRVNASDIIELGEAGQPLTFLSPLTNNTQLLGRDSTNLIDFNLVKVTAADIITIGEAGVSMSLVSGLANATYLLGRTTAPADIHLIGVNASNIIELGAATQRMTVLSPLSNATKLLGSNAAGNATINLIGVTAADAIETGVVGTQNTLLGTVVAPVIDPPTIEGQVTAASQCKAFGYVTAGGGASLGQNYNIDSVTRNAAGDFTVKIDRDFSAATYATVVTVLDNALNLTWRVNGQAAGQFDVHVRDSVTGVLTDPDAFSFCCFGILS